MSHGDRGAGARPKCSGSVARAKRSLHLTRNQEARSALPDRLGYCRGAPACTRGKLPILNAPLEPPN